MPRREPFASEAELDQYLAGDTVECLHCGKRFRGLPRHLTSTHQISVEAYREQWGIPAGRALVGRDTSQQLSERIRTRIADGRMTYDHLPRAVEAARAAEKWPRVDITRDKQRGVAAAIPREPLAPGAKRADGRDADRAREYQRHWRAKRGKKR